MIRKLSEKDFEQSIKLSEYAFQYSVPENELEIRKERMKYHIVWGHFDGDELTSKLHLFPLHIFQGTQELAMGGIAGVSTWPERRRGGNVTKLLTVAMEHMKEQGQTVSFLHPFDVAFYRRFGWELTFSLKKYTIEKSQLHFMDKVPGEIRRVDLKNNLPILNELYEKFAQRFNGMLKRDTYWWENHVESEGFHFAVYFNEKGEPRGYLFYQIKDKVMDVQEMIYLDHEARKGLWNFICQHDSMIEKVKMVVPENDELPYLLKNPKIKIEVEPYFMARIVDVHQYLNIIKLNELEESLVLHVQDSFAEWNNISLEIKNGLVKETTKEAPGVTLDIQTLSALMFGAQPVYFLVEAEKIQGTAEAIHLLEKVIPKREPSILDFF